MRECFRRGAVSTITLTVLAVVPAFASESFAEDRVRQVENGLLPRVSLRENLGRTESIIERMRAWGIPGVSIAVIDQGRVAWVRAYGVSDTVEQTPVTPETLFQAGSVSKPIAALGALRLVKEGKLSLDDGINATLKTWRVPDNEFSRDTPSARSARVESFPCAINGFIPRRQDSSVPGDEATAVIQAATARLLLPAAARGTIPCMPIRIIRLGDDRAPNEGLRIGTVRRPPRGVPKDEFASRNFYDVWLPNLAPSEELLKEGLSVTNERGWKAFARRYRAEMKAPEVSRVLDTLAALSHQTNFAVGCYCADESRCHRSLLRELLVERGAEVL